MVETRAVDHIVIFALYKWPSSPSESPPLFNPLKGKHRPPWLPATYINISALTNIALELELAARGPEDTFRNFFAFALFQKKQSKC
jgi:hypothetical protein